LTPSAVYAIGDGSFAVLTLQRKERLMTAREIANFVLIQEAERELKERSGKF
jgi:hypothetical protein